MYDLVCLQLSFIQAEKNTGKAASSKTAILVKGLFFITVQFEKADNGFDTTVASLFMRE